jgi:hypothetical protein
MDIRLKGDFLEWREYIETFHSIRFRGIRRPRRKQLQIYYGGCNGGFVGVSISVRFCIGLGTFTSPSLSRSKSCVTSKRRRVKPETFTLRV